MGESVKLSIGKGGYRLLAYVSVALAVVGVVLPLMPTTVFVLIAAWAAGRSSPEFEAWLLNHQTYGPIISIWRERGVVALLGKVLACVMLTISWSILFFTGSPVWLLVGLGVFFLCLATYLLSRPSC
jgi:uncharacterized membrane protein YbaN (DUF454 family)